MISCFKPSRVQDAGQSRVSKRVQQLNALIDTLTLQLNRAPFHAMADTLTQGLQSIFPAASLIELYVLAEDQLSIMSQYPHLDQELYSSLQRLDKGTPLHQAVLTKKSQLITSPTDLPYNDRGYRMGMAAPWIQQGTPEGLILVLGTGPFDASDLEWLALVATITNTFSLSTKVSNEVRRQRRLSTLPQNLIKSSLALQKYQATARTASANLEALEMQDNRILE